MRFLENEGYDRENVKESSEIVWVEETRGVRVHSSMHRVLVRYQADARITRFEMCAKENIARPRAGSAHRHILAMAVYPTSIKRNPQQLK